MSESEAVSRAEYDRVCAELAETRKDLDFVIAERNGLREDLESLRRTAPETLSHANCATCAAAHDRHLPPVYATRNP